MQNPQLNPQQKKAVEHGTGPLLIIAGAGTGKTTVITERIKHLILNKKISPQNILALTFTEKAAKEMQERIDVALPYGYSDMWIHTFHGFCDRILRNEGLHIGLTSNYRLLTEVQSILFLRDHLFDFDLKYFRPLGNPDKFLQGLLNHFSRLKDEDIAPKEYEVFAKILAKKKDPEITEDYKKQIEELSHAYTTYETLKTKEAVMDFSDLISNTLLLFRSRSHILRFYQKRFQYLLVDEFQDTNFAQNQLVLLLSGKENNITVSADDDQALYKWRGASISNVLQFTKNFPDSDIVSLTSNYRTSQTILDTAYRVIQNNNPNRLEVKEKIDKHLQAMTKDTTQHKVSFINEDREDLEAEQVVKKIQELHSKQYMYKDFAILVRANDHAQPFLRTLSRYNIPHQFLGPGKLFHQEEIKDLIAYLKILYNHEDAQSLYRVLTMNTFHIPPSDIALLLHVSKKQSKHLFEIVETYETLSLSEEAMKGIETLLHLITKHKNMVTKETAGKILYDFLENSGLMQQYIQITTEEDDIKAQNTSKFFEKLKQFETHNDNASVYAVVDWLDLSMELGESPLATEIDWSENDAVNILTIHSSKGLEFPVVFIVNLVTQRFPSRERSEQIPMPQELIKEILPIGDFHLQEERRLFYVALTRAKEYVFLTASRNYGEGKTERKVSPFVFEALDTIDTMTKEKKMPTTMKDLFPKKIDEIKTTSLKPLQVTYLSYSQIQTFDICPLHYKLKYLLNIPILPQASLSFGTSVHLALKEFYARSMQGEKLSIKNVPQILESVWINEGYMGQKHIDNAFKGAVSMLKKYLTKNFDIKNLPIELEFPFQFALNNLKIGGRIDRIDKKNDGSYEIIDYKTGNSKNASKNIQNNLQLSIYALAAKSIPGIGKNYQAITVSLHYVETGEIMSTKFSKEDLEKATEKILKKKVEIEQSNFKCSKSLFCENCEYTMLCQAQL